MKIRKAVYAASLDPITNGHIDVINRMAPLYDEVVVIVAVDARKTYTFSSEERASMTKAAVAHLSNVSVDVCVGRYVVKHADSIGAQVIIRGLRNSSDLEVEQVLAEENRAICPHIETMLVSCRPELMHVSSSMVKGHVGIDPGWEVQVARSVPAAVAAKLKDKWIIRKAKGYWAGLMPRFGNPPTAEKTFAGLVSNYGELDRHYHNLAHIVGMLDELEDFRLGYPAGAFMPDYEVIALATWFHDAVYSPKAGNNEEVSAELACMFLERCKLNRAQLKSMQEKVSDLIMSTKHTGPPHALEGEIIVDLDLAILGRPAAEFDLYEAGIRKEYAHVPEGEFATKRTEILRSFLARPTIYATDFFRLRYESAARKNLERSIKKLQG
ncbi:MAG: pantetheine-phosphate adenylyltransferase [Patescibacteria group bacterium]